MGSWNDLAEKLIQSLSSDFNLILRPHPSQSLTPRSKDRRSFKRVKVLAEKRPNTFVDLTSQPLSDLQSIADLLVSDANSPAEESLFYDVPQLFVETSSFSRDYLASLANKEGMHPDDTEQLLTLYECGPSLNLKHGHYDINREIEKAISDSSSYSLQREKYFSWVFGSRNRLAAENVARAIKTKL